MHLLPQLATLSYLLQKQVLGPVLRGGGQNLSNGLSVMYLATRVSPPQ